MQAHVARYGAELELWRLYAPVGDAAPSRESLELYGAGLREMKIILGLIDPYLASLPADDPNREVRIQALSQMYRTWGQLIVSGVSVAADRRVPEASRAALVTNMTPVLRAIFPKLEVERQNGIRDALTKLEHDAAKGPFHDAVLEALKGIAS